MIADILATIVLVIILIIIFACAFYLPYLVLRDEWRLMEWRRQRRCTHFVDNVCVDPPVTWKDLFRWRS